MHYSRLSDGQQITDAVLLITTKNNWWSTGGSDSEVREVKRGTQSEKRVKRETIT